MFQLFFDLHFHSRDLANHQPLPKLPRAVRSPLLSFERNGMNGGEEMREIAVWVYSFSWLEDDEEGN